MSSIIKRLYTVLGESPSSFNPEAFLLECFNGAEPHHQLVYEAMTTVLGPKSSHALYSAMFELCAMCLEQGRTGKIPFLSLIRDAALESEHVERGLNHNIKTLRYRCGGSNEDLLAKLAVQPRELAAYIELVKHDRPVIVDLIRMNYAAHIAVLMESYGLKSPLEFRSLVKDNVSLGHEMMEDLLYTPLDGSFRDVREMLLGSDEPGLQERILRATVFLNPIAHTKYTHPPETAPLSQREQDFFGAKIMSDVIAEVIEKSKFVLDTAQARFFDLGLKNLSKTGLRLEYAVYTSYQLGYGLGYLDDLKDPVGHLEAVRDSMERLGYGKEGVAKRKKSNQVSHSLADVFCNHLLDALPERDANSLLTTDGYLIERIRHTGNTRLLERLKDKSYIDHHFAADLGL